MELECNKPGGCGPHCRSAIARGDDMATFWPDPHIFDFLEEDMPLEYGPPPMNADRIKSLIATMRAEHAATTPGLSYDRDCPIGGRCGHNECDWFRHGPPFHGCPRETAANSANWRWIDHAHERELEVADLLEAQQQEIERLHTTAQVWEEQALTADARWLEQHINSVERIERLENAVRLAVSAIDAPAIRANSGESQGHS